jgi:hypothetical protein
MHRITPEFVVNIPQKKRPHKGAFSNNPEGLSAGRAVHAQWVRPAEAVTLTRLVTDVAGVEVAVHAVLQRSTHKVLHTVRHVCSQEPSIVVGQEVVNCVSFRNRTVVLQCVDIVVSSS